MISHFRRLLSLSNKNQTLGGRNLRMYWINVLIWILIGLSIATVIVLFGSRSTWRLIETFSAKRSIQGDASETPTPQPPNSDSIKSTNANREEAQLPKSDEQIKDMVLKKQYESISKSCLRGQG